MGGANPFAKVGSASLSERGDSYPPDRATSSIAGSQRVILADHPWPDLELERNIFAAAGLELIAGPVVAGTSSEVELLVEQNDPIAIMTCWANVSSRAIASPKDLAIVARIGVGLDNIDVASATNRGAWVSNVPDYCVSEVSDHAIALLLSHYRGIARLDTATKNAGWRSDSSGLERVADLTVAIIGYGRIGRETARKLRAFGCQVLAASPSFEKSDDWAQPADLARIQRDADAIILHAPLTQQTNGLIDAPFLKACRRRPLLINVSRGGLVDNSALIAALDSGQLRGAALDVVDGEPEPPVAVTARLDVIATPHVAYASTASLVELRRRACEEVVRAVRGQPLQHPCNDPKFGTPLDGGVASDIRIVAGPDGPQVIKRALGKLKVSADWFSDPARSAIEVAAIDTFVRLLGPGSVPEILWARPAENTFAMRLVDPRLRNWKQDLLAGFVDPATATSAGRLLGRLHERSACDESARVQFDDRTYFRELRVEPFFNYVADRNPEHATQIRSVVSDMDMRRSALVHGDYSPKNILADGEDIVVLDFEVAHWGDPRFDVGFCLSHLLLKSLRRGADSAAFTETISAFLRAYSQNGPSVIDSGLSQITACLLLARLEGKSPVDYLADLDPRRVRAIAREMLMPGVRGVDDIIQKGLKTE